MNKAISNHYRIVHIDDQQYELDDFKALCKRHEAAIELNSFAQPGPALQHIANHPPNIVVLDIEMGQVSGLDLARQLADAPYMIVFLTSHTTYAIEAFQLCALHYLVKPAGTEQLTEMLRRYDRLQSGIAVPQTAQLDALATLLHQPKVPVQQVFIYHTDRVSIVQVPNIVYLEAENSYTRFYTGDGKKILSSETLKTYDDILSGHSSLIRIHRSYMVNKTMVKEIRSANRQWHVVMTNGAQLEVSRLKKDWVMAQLTG